MKYRNFLLLSLLCLGVGMGDMSYAANGNFGNSTAATAAGNTGVGSNTGSITNPWIIEDCIDLQASGSGSVGSAGNAHEEYYAFYPDPALNDGFNGIDCSATNPSYAGSLPSATWGSTGFDPIGKSTSFHPMWFETNFFTDGVVIRNLYINRPSENNVGLFAYDGTYISNIGLENVDITGGLYVAGLAAKEDNSVNFSYVTGSVTSVAVGPYAPAGMIAAHSTSINDSYAIGSVVSSGGFVGGLLGHNSGWSLNNLYFSGSVTGTDRVGGLAGHDDGGIREGYANADLVATTGSNIDYLNAFPDVDDTRFYNSFYEVGSTCSASGGTITTCDGSSGSPGYQFSSAPAGSLATPAWGEVNMLWDWAVGTGDWEYVQEQETPALQWQNLTSLNSAPSTPTSLIATNTGTTTPTLSAIYTDSEGDGTIDFTIYPSNVTDCDSPESSAVQSTLTSSTVSSGNPASVVTTPLSNGDYVFCAQADDGSLISSFAGPESFTVAVNSAPSAPTLPTPADALVDAPVDTTLAIGYSDPDGDTGSVTFTVYDADPLDCSSPDAGANVVGIPETVSAVTSDTDAVSNPLSLSNSTSYFWCARANDGTVDGDFAGPFSFTTASDGPLPGSIDDVLPVGFNSSAFSVVDTPGSTDAFGGTTPAGVSLTTSVPGAVIQACDVLGHTVSVTFVFPNTTADIHCDDDSFYIGNIVGFGPFPAAVVAFNDPTGTKPSFNAILRSGEFRAIDPPNTWEFLATENIESLTLNEGSANEVTLTFSGMTDLVFSENSDGTQSIVSLSGALTLTDAAGDTLVLNGGTADDGDAQALVLDLAGDIVTSHAGTHSNGVLSLSNDNIVPDKDDDTYPDDIDTCPSVPNADQSDTSGCGFTGMYVQFVSGDIAPAYRDAAFEILRNTSHTTSLSPSRRTNKTLTYIREMVKRATGSAPQVKAAAVATNTLLNLAGGEELNEADGSDSNIYSTLRKLRAWRFENL